MLLGDCSELSEAEWEEGGNGGENVDGFGAIQNDLNRGFLQLFVFEQSLAAGAAGADREVLKSASLFCCYGNVCHPLAGIVGAGGEACGAFGACAGGEGSVFLVGAADYGAILEAYGCADVEIAVRGIGAFCCAAGLLHELSLLGGEFFEGAGEEGDGYVEVFHIGDFLLTLKFQTKVAT